jgi:polysaccharide biosynthesis protein VpsQ
MRLCGIPSEIPFQTSKSPPYHQIQADMRFLSSKLSILNAKQGWNFAAFFYATLFLITLLLAYTGNLPSQFNQIPYYDKAGHVILYAIAIYLGQRLLNYRKICLFGITMPLWVLLFGLFTYVEEGIQAFSPNRTLDGMDLICSTIGLLVGYWLAERSRRV